MAQENWKQVKDIFVQALEQKEEVRKEFLKNACDDENILREVESLLASHDSAESFMESPAGAEIIKTKALETSQLNTGQNIKSYEIIEKIGEGGMGEVYLANDTKLKRNIALKLLPVELTDNKDLLKRFEQEAFAVSGLNHPNILTIHEFGKFENTNFIATEFIEGKTLRDKLRSKPTELKEILNIAVQMTSALVTAHQAGIIHRDIKPENVMIREDGIVKLLDFGLAKPIEIKTLEINKEDETKPQVNTKSGIIMGTPQYMSPEQARSKTVDERTDIWSLGIVFYEMITGVSPFAEETPGDTIAAILKTEPKPFPQTTSDFFKRFENIIRKCLQKKAKNRYQNTKDLLADLEDLKQDVEFEAKLEQSVQPNLVGFNENEDEKTAIIKEQNSVEQIATTAEQRNISSAEYITESVKQNKFAAFGVLAMLLISILGFGYYRYFIAESQITSIAVLPFENGNDDEDIEYLSDGLSEDLINRLSQLPQLKVISRQSSFKFNSKDANFQEIGNKLDVKAVVAGKIQKVGDQLTIRVEMVDTSDNKQIWGERYIKTVDDVLAIQNEIARVVSEKLHLKLTGQQKKEVAGIGTDNDEAYQLYLNGSRARSSDKAIEYYKKSIELDPNFALPYAEIAIVYLHLAWESMMDPKEAIPKAKELVQKALELNPNLAEAHFALGYIKIFEWDFEESKIQFEKAIELRPNMQRLHVPYALFLTYMGEREKAFSEMKMAQTLDPLTNLVRLESHLLIQARRYEEAIEKLRNNIEIRSDVKGSWHVLGYALAANGNYKEAINAYKKAIDLSYKPDEIGSLHVYLGAAYALSGNREKALEILKKIEEEDRTKDGYISYSEFSIIYGALGDKDKAFQMLEKAYERKDLQLTTLYADPAFEPLRDDPRFTDLARRVGLPQAK